MSDSTGIPSCEPSLEHLCQALREKLTALEAREQLLRESEAQYRLVFDKNPCPMWVFDQATLGFLAVNEQAVIRYGYTRDEFLAMTIDDICPAEEISRLLTYVEETRDARTLALRLTGEWKHCRKDGTIIDVEVSAVSMTFQAREAMFVLIADVTVRKRMETTLRQGEQFYRLLIDHFPNGSVAVFDQELRYRLVGGMELSASGVSKERFEGKTIWEAFPVSICHILEPCYRKALAGQEALVEVPFMQRVLLVHALPIGDAHGAISAGMVVTQDITRHKRREERLRRSGRRYRTLAEQRERQLIASDRLVSFGELAASLAHEFNNPLGIAMGFAQDVLSETRPKDRRYRRLQIIVEETRRCGQLMKNLLELAAPPQTTLMTTDLTALIRHSLELIAGHAQKSQVTVVYDCPSAFPTVHADPQQLEQVLLNLYFNAIEAMPEGGTLTVHVGSTLSSKEHQTEEQRAVTPEVTITVHDTGQGIAPADLPKIFHSFFTTKKQRGMGLGLSICQGILRAHGGRITVQSNPGHGTSFVLHLPMRDAHDDTGPRENFGR